MQERIQSEKAGILQRAVQEEERDEKMSMITAQIEGLKELATKAREKSKVEIGGSTYRAECLYELLEDAADTIERLEKGYNTIYYTPIEAEAYQKAFEDIRAEIRSNAFYENPRIQRVIREADVLSIIDKHDPDKVGKEWE